MGRETISQTCVKGPLNLLVKRPVDFPGGSFPDGDQRWVTIYHGEPLRSLVAGIARPQLALVTRFLPPALLR